MRRAPSGAGGVALGAGKRLLRTALWCGVAMLGLVPGAVAAIGAETAWQSYKSRFDFPWEPDWRLWGALPFCGALLLSVCGVAAFVC